MVIQILHFQSTEKENRLSEPHILSQSDSQASYWTFYYKNSCLYATPRICFNIIIDSKGGVGTRHLSMGTLDHNLVGPVDGSPMGAAIIVVVSVLSCVRLGFSCAASLPFLCMAGQLV